MKKCGWIYETGFGCRSEGASRMVEGRKGLIHQWGLDEEDRTHQEL